MFTNFKIILLVISSFLVSCQSCLSVLYKVNDRSFVDIQFPRTNLSSDFLQYYLDSVYTRNRRVPDSIYWKFFANRKIHDREVLIYFNDKPCEAYLISFDATPPWIMYLYNSKISHSLISDSKDLRDSEIGRIRNRLKMDIINKADEYRKAMKVPDSLALIDP